MGQIFLVKNGKRGSQNPKFLKLYHFLEKPHIRDLIEGQKNAFFGAGVSLW